MLLKNVIPSHCLERLKYQLRQLFKAEPNQTLESAILAREAESHKSVYEASLTAGSSIEAYKLIAAANLDEYAELVLGPGCYHVTPLHIAVQIPRSSAFDWAWHIESDYYPWAPEILNVWLPVLASTVANVTGSIGLIPGSHLKLTKGVAIRPDGHTPIVCELDPGQEESGIQIEAEPGDMLLFHKDLLHKTCPNTSNVPRVTGIARVIDQAKLTKPRPLYKEMA